MQTHSRASLFDSDGSAPKSGPQLLSQRRLFRRGGFAAISLRPLACVFSTANSTVPWFSHLLYAFHGGSLFTHLQVPIDITSGRVDPTTSGRIPHFVR
jgi:hypothetical protein